MLARIVSTTAVIAWLSWPAAALAQDGAAPEPAPADRVDGGGEDGGEGGEGGGEGGREGGASEAGAEAATESTTRDAADDRAPFAQRAVSIVTRRDLHDRAPRNLSEALELTPGVSVLATGRAGGAPFVRGLTGRHTVILVDGFRLGTASTRGGTLAAPDPHLDAVDAAALARIEVLRGGGSVRHGADAIGGVIALHTRAPGSDSLRVAGALRAASADRSGSGRAEVEAGGDPDRPRVLAGVGARRFGDLRGGGPLAGAAVPVYDGDVQRFTGYDELSGDARVVIPVGADGRGELTAALLALHRFDAPRADECTLDPLDCRVVDQRFYDIAYLKYHGRARGGTPLARLAGLPGFDEIELGVALASTHETRSRTVAERDLVSREFDRAITLAATARAALPAWRPGAGDGEGDTALQVSFGAESYLDLLEAEASERVISTGFEQRVARGRYIDGSRYARAAGWAFAELAASRDLGFTGGVRLSRASARVGADPETGADAIARAFVAPSATLGVRVRLADSVHLVGNLDRGFRAPDLGDLSARDADGAVFQLPDRALDAETSVAFEAGAIVHHPRISASAFVYQTFIDGFITRDPASCPDELVDACGDAAAVFQLVNADAAEIHGIELAASGAVVAGLTWFGAVSRAVASRVVVGGDDEPESTIPPLHGHVGLRWTGGEGSARRWFAEGVVRWADTQDRLSAADQADARIPAGGTPGYAVLDVRAGIRLRDDVRASLAVVNAFDSAYRVHGSGVDGPGLGVVLSIAGAMTR